MLSSLLIAGLCAAAVADTVERRGREPALEGEVTRIDDAGITVRSSLGAVHFVPWDRVRRVEARAKDPMLEQRLALATDLWRARSRVERNDMTLAEPLLERLFERFRGQTHETALVVAEGLLRCRLARADHVLAVVPALEVARLRRADVSTETYSQLPPIFDHEYALCTQLAPAWLPSPQLEALAHDLKTHDAQGDRVVAAMAGLYRQALLPALGRAAETSAPEREPDHPGVRLLDLLVATGDADEAKRRTAREQLKRMLKTLSGWSEAWVRFHLGRSLIREGMQAREEGAVHLIHLPARFGRTQPYLAALGLGYVAETLKRDGNDEGAERMRAQLQRTYPYLAGAIEIARQEQAAPQRGHE